MVQNNPEYDILYELVSTQNIFRISYLNPTNPKNLDISVFEVSIDKDKSLPDLKNGKFSVRIPLLDIPHIKSKLDLILSKETSQENYKTPCACGSGLIHPESKIRSCGNFLCISQKKDQEYFIFAIRATNPRKENKRIQLESQIPLHEIENIKNSLGKIIANYDLISCNLKKNLCEL